MNNIEIYTTESCPYCIKAKKLFKMLSLNYKEHNVEKSFDKMLKTLEQKHGLTGISTVPQIIINGKYVGGYDDLEQLYKTQKLNEFLN